VTTRWTRLHAEPGDPPGPISSDQVRRSVDAKLPESDDLDWKKGLPGAAGLDEFAKDVAAMASSAGGLLVYGVEEKRSAGRAEALSLLELTGPDVRGLRSTVFGQIQPAVTGVDFLELASDQEPGSVLVVSVPASEDAPHPRHGPRAVTPPG